MNLIRWEPFREAENLFRDFGFPVFARFPRLFGENGETAIEWSPVADISETEKEYLVKAELPGVKREDVKVTMEDGILTIQGERKQEKEEKGEKFHRVESFYGSFCRRFTIPENVDAASIRAECKDGVLRVHIPKVKTEKSKPVEIKIQ